MTWLTSTNSEPDGAEQIVLDTNIKPIKVLSAAVGTTNQINEFCGSENLLDPANHSSRWIIDSGCSRHVTPSRALFTEITLSDKGEKLMVADGRTMSILGYGTVELAIRDTEGILGNITLCDVAWVPSFAFNLISTTRLQDKGGEVLLTPTSSTKVSTISFHEGRIQIPLSKWNNLHVLNTDRDEKILNILSSHLVSSSSTGVDLELIHARLGHKSINSIKKLEGKVDGLVISRCLWFTAHLAL